MNFNNESKVTIGMPVYNGEKFLRKRLNSILSQTYGEFELIISDNASTDSTPVICEEFNKVDTRIRYIRQKKNIGALKNYHFVLNQAKYHYFVWAAVDDRWEPTFLEKNIQSLFTNKNLVGSISRVQPYGMINREISSNQFFKNLIKNINSFFSHYGAYSAYGTYEHKVRKYLDVNSAQSMYAVYKTAALKNSFIDVPNASEDLCIILKVLSYGDLHVGDEVLLYCYVGGLSSKGKIMSLRRVSNNRFEFLFPYYTFTKWCFKNLGSKIFLKNLDKFIKINTGGFFAVVYDLILRTKNSKN